MFQATKLFTAGSGVSKAQKLAHLKSDDNSNFVTSYADFTI